jgi:hypothetical protein
VSAVQVTPLSVLIRQHRRTPCRAYIGPPGFVAGTIAAIRPVSSNDTHKPFWADRVASFRSAAPPRSDDANKLGRVRSALKQVRQISRTGARRTDTCAVPKTTRRAPRCLP